MQQVAGVGPVHLVGWHQTWSGGALYLVRSDMGPVGPRARARARGCRPHLYLTSPGPAEIGHNSFIFQPLLI